MALRQQIFLVASRLVGFFGSQQLFSVAKLSVCLSICPFIGPSIYPSIQAATHQGSMLGAVGRLWRVKIRLATSNSNLRITPGIWPLELPH